LINLGSTQEGGDPMSARSPRSIIAFSIVIGALSGCAHHPASSPAQPQAAPAKGPNVINSETIANSSGQPIEKILADRVAGVRLGRAPDGSLTVQIRGAVSADADAQPRYVIDGATIAPVPGGSLFGSDPSSTAPI